MPKRFYISKQQKKLLEEMKLTSSPSSPLIDIVKSGDDPYSNSSLFPFGKESVIGLLGKRFNEVNEYFTDDMSSISDEDVSNKLNHLIQVCIDKERNIRPQLERICFNTIMELFNVPDNAVDFTCKLVDSISFRSQFHIKADVKDDFEYDDVSSMETSHGNVDKRKMLDCLEIGGAMRLARKGRKIAMDEIFDIDESLPHLYSKITKLNEYLLFKQVPEIKDENTCQSAYVKTYLGDDDTLTKIYAEGIIFPMLLTESIRGFMELFTSHGLPDDIEETHRLINLSDVLEDEPWHMCIGPSIWDRLIPEDVEATEIPDFLMTLSELSDEDFQKLMKEVIANTKAGKNYSQQILDYCRHAKEQDAFDNDMVQKQNQKDVIADSYFTEEELNSEI